MKLLIGASLMPRAFLRANPGNRSIVSAVHQYSFRLIEFPIFRGTSIIKFFHGV